jgi:hypothetical protein
MGLSDVAGLDQRPGDPAQSMAPHAVVSPLGYVQLCHNLTRQLFLYVSIMQDRVSVPFMGQGLGGRLSPRASFF